LRRPRSFATVSEFGEKVLVAGGEYPIHETGSSASVLNDTGEVYDPATGSFDADFVPLAVGVAHHAAVPLDSGEIALIGGRTQADQASSFIQIVSPLTRTSNLLGTLNVGRNAPTALHLDDGRLFIAGGEDASGKPIGALEWRGADAGPLPAPFAGSVMLPPRFDRAYAALPGGAVLAVGGCEDRAPQSGEDCAQECQRGCPPSSDAGSPAFEAFWISADARVTELSLYINAGRPSLLAGSDGSPWLIAANAELFRFDPWHGQFDPLETGLSVDGTLARARFVAMGLDSFAWITEGAQGVTLRGMRVGTRSAFSNDVELVTARDPDDPTRPAHLVPDRAPSVDISYEGGPGALTFATSAAGVSKPCVWLSDARFADFSAEFAFSSNTSPSLRLGSTQFVDPAVQADGSCSLPAFSGGALGGRLLLERIGNQAALTIGNAHSECSIGSERLAVGVCASELGAVRVTRVKVKRRD
jgi:hypothetical protein